MPKRGHQVGSEKEKQEKNKIPLEALYLPSFAMTSLLVLIVGHIFCCMFNVVVQRPLVQRAPPRGGSCCSLRPLLMIRRHNLYWIDHGRLKSGRSDRSRDTRLTLAYIRSGRHVL